MAYLFSNANRFGTWRKLWTNLAIAEKKLGIDTITDEAIEQMKNNCVRDLVNCHIAVCRADGFVLNTGTHTRTVRDRGRRRKEATT